MQRSYLVFLFTFVFATKSKHRKQHAQVQEDLHVKLYPLLLEVLRFGLEFQ